MKLKYFKVKDKTGGFHTVLSNSLVDGSKILYRAPFNGELLACLIDVEVVKELVMSLHGIVEIGPNTFKYYLSVFEGDEVIYEEQEVVVIVFDSPYWTIGEAEQEIITRINLNGLMQSF